MSDRGKPGQSAACANPGCGRRYEQGTGELVLVKHAGPEPFPWEGIRAVWLCDRCRKQYTVVYNIDDHEISLVETLNESAA